MGTISSRWEEIAARAGKLDFLAEKARQLPLEPGVYRMRDKNGHIIYVGKAKALRSRVSSYFRSVEKHTEKVYSMVMNVWDFDTIICDSEFEALILECSLIKQNNPKYNILLKDDKGYHYIQIWPKEWSRITAQKNKPQEGARLIGPYISSFTVHETVDEVNKIFCLPTCSRKFPQDFGRERPCLNYHIHQCMGVCQGKISLEEYQEIIEQAVDFINGGSAETLKRLKEQMELAAENLDFEKAARCRDHINAIQKIGEHQKVVSTHVEDMDAAAFAQDGESICGVILKIRGQRLRDKQEFLLGKNEALTLADARRELVMRYYASGQEEIPKLIALDEDFEDSSLVQQMLQEKAGRKVELFVPARGDNRKLVEMARNNASQRLAANKPYSNRDVAALDELARLLGLKNPPKYIEAYDISNIGSETVVAGMVVFEDGKPLKNAYKRFSIKTVDGTDDYASMREVLTRRINRYFEEQEKPDSTFRRLPDLVLLDGGKGHVAAVEPIFRELGFDVPLFGMVKDSRHKTRAIAGDGGEIAISTVRSAFTLVSKIQEEVHRYSIAYSRSKHQKSGFAMELTSVPGIGQTRAKKLFQHFRTVKAMKAASLEELEAAPGMTKQTAQALYAYLREEFPPEEGTERPDGENLNKNTAEG